MLNLAQPSTDPAFYLKSCQISLNKSDDGDIFWCIRGLDTVNGLEKGKRE